jgi:hypothetical protein
MNWVRILNSELFFPGFGTPWVHYLNTKGVFLKFLGVNEDFQRVREVNPSFGYINPIWAATEYIFIAHNSPTLSQSTHSCYQKLWSTDTSKRWSIAVSDTRRCSTLVWHPYDTCRNSQTSVEIFKQVSLIFFLCFDNI